MNGYFKERPHNVPVEDGEDLIVVYRPDAASAACQSSTADDPPPDSEEEEDHFPSVEKRELVLLVPVNGRNFDTEEKRFVPHIRLPAPITDRYEQLEH